MILTKATDCSQITVASDYFTQDAAEDWTSFTLYSKGCDEDDWTSVKTFTHGTTEQTVTAADLGYSTTIDDGVYCFRLTSIPVSGDTINEYGSVFADCTIKCTIDDAIGTDYESDLPVIHQAVVYATECSDCDCDRPCTIYEYLLAKLDEPNNPCRYC